MEHWLANHPRVTSLFLPTYCPRANPIERAFADMHDTCTRNHRARQLLDLVADVEQHIHMHGPGKYRLAQTYHQPVITSTVEKIAPEQRSRIAD